MTNTIKCITCGKKSKMKGNNDACPKCGSKNTIMEENNK